MSYVQNWQLQKDKYYIFKTCLEVHFRPINKIVTESSAISIHAGTKEINN